MGDFDWSSVYGTFGDGASNYDTSSLGDSDWGSWLGDSSSGSGSSGYDWGSLLVVGHQVVARIGVTSLPLSWAD